MDSELKSGHARKTGEKRCVCVCVFPFNYLLFHLLNFFLSFSPPVFPLIPLLPPFELKRILLSAPPAKGPGVSTHKAWPSLTPRQPLCPIHQAEAHGHSSPPPPFIYRTSWKPLSLPLTSMRPWHTRKIYSGIISSSEKGPRILEGRSYRTPLRGAPKAAHICLEINCAATTRVDELAKNTRSWGNSSKPDSDIKTIIHTPANLNVLFVTIHGSHGPGRTVNHIPPQEVGRHLRWAAPRWCRALRFGGISKSSSEAVLNNMPNS